MQYNNNEYSKQQTLQQNSIVPTCTIVHPRLDVVGITDVQDISKNICNRIQVKKSIQRHTICLTDAGCDCILD